MGVKGAVPRDGKCQQQPGNRDNQPNLPAPSMLVSWDPIPGDIPSRTGHQPVMVMMGGICPTLPATPGWGVHACMYMSVTPNCSRARQLASSFCYAAPSMDVGQQMCATSSQHGRGGC